MSIAQDLSRLDEKFAPRQLRVDAFDFVEFFFGETGFETLFASQFAAGERKCAVGLP